MSVHRRVRSSEWGTGMKRKALSGEKGSVSLGPEYERVLMCRTMVRRLV